MKKPITLILFTYILISCNTNRQQQNQVKEIAISILPQEYFVKKIAGDYLKINVIIPSGASPASYEPTPVQISSLSSTDLYLKIGYTGFEMAWMQKLAASNKNMKIVDLAEGVKLIKEESLIEDAGKDHHHGGVNPHIWMSPENVRIISKNIYMALASAYPSMEDVFHENLMHFNKELDSLDNYIYESLSDLSSRTFFIYHPSLSYFARDYNLLEYPLELNGKTPSASHMKKLIDIGIEQNIRVVFLQMQFDQRNAEVLANELGAEIVQINPLDPEWYKQMVYITNKLKTNLQ